MYVPSNSNYAINLYWARQGDAFFCTRFMRFLVSPLPEGNVCVCVCVCVGWGGRGVAGRPIGWPQILILLYRLTSPLPHPFPEFFLASFPAIFLRLLPSSSLFCRLSTRMLNFTPHRRSFSLLHTGFSRFPCVYKQMLRWFPRFQVATTCFSCSPPDLDLAVTNFIFCIHVK